MGHVQVAVALLAAKANVDKLDNLGWTALTRAVKKTENLISEKRLRSI